MSRARDIANLQSSKITADAGIDIDNINIDGTEIGLSSGDLTIAANHASGDLIFEANGATWYFTDGDATQFSFQHNSGNITFNTAISNDDFIITGVDDGSAITALTLDMSQAGEADFNSAIKVGGSIVAHQTNRGVLEYSSNNFMMRAYGASSGDGFITFKTGGGGGSTDTERMRIDSSGRVGIGNASPTYALDIKAGTNTNPLRIGLTTDSYGYLTFANSSGDVGYIGLGAGAAVGNGNASTFAIRGQQELRFATGGNNEALLLDTSQNATFAGSVSIGSGAAATGIHSNAKVLEISGGDGGDLIIGNNASSNIGAGAHIGAIAFKNIDTSTGTAPLYAGIRCESVDTSGNMDLRFYTGTANLESDSPQAMFTSAGTFLVGKTSSDGAVAGFEARADAIVYATLSSGATYYLHDTSANKFYVNANGGIYNYQSNDSNLSDEREKKNITSLGSKWNAVKKWSLKEFHYNADADSDNKKCGVIAQDIEDDHPE